jgi:hypothetical protein
MTTLLWRASVATAVSLCAMTAVIPAQTAMPDAADLARRVREAVRLDYELQAHFGYIEQRRDVRVSKMGRVEVGAVRTFEVYPSAVSGRTYKRLIAIDGRPLSEAELARGDREHAAHLAAEAARLKRDTARERAARLKVETDARRERDAIIDDGFAVFEPAAIGREIVDGQPMVVVALTPNPAATVATREGRWMKQFEGRAWISQNDYQIARLEMRARDDVTIGWGILGRLHEGSRFVFARRKFENAWLPAEVVFDATGRTLLFRKFDIDLVTTYSGYKRTPLAPAPHD